MAEPSLTGWLEAARPGSGVFMADDNKTWRFLEYGELAASARRIASALRSEGVRPGDVVCVVLPTDHVCIATMYAVWFVGATVCPVVPPAFQKPAEYAAHVAKIFAVARPALTVSAEAYAPMVARGLAGAGLSRPPWVVRLATEEAQRQKAADIALLQFTSGSTSNPRGVSVPLASLEANIGAILRWVGWRSGDATASWLPLHHDMGLIGCLLSTVSAQGDLRLMRPDQFIRDPGRWLECFSEGGAQHTASPTFGLAYCTRRVSDERLAGLDFRNWRTAIIGAEPVNAQVLEMFARRLAPRGFSRGAFAPAYGLAEATLAVTGVGSGRVPRLVRPDWSGLRFGGQVTLARDGRLGDPVPVEDGGWLVGCGGALEGLAVAVHDESGQVLPDLHLGEVTVAGASVAAGYQDGSPVSASRFDQGFLRTGDAGFQHQGELYVIGRMGDSIKVRGRSVYLEDLEDKIASAGMLSRARLAVVSAPGGGPDGLGTGGAEMGGVVVLVEGRVGPWVKKVLAVLTAELGADHIFGIMVGSVGLIERTSSGKPRRFQMWQRLQAGGLRGDMITSDAVPR